jgi:hypothetical protein
VLLAIADCASADGGNAWPSNAELRRKSGLGERAVQAAVADLVNLGELEVGYNDGPGGCNRYRVVMDDPRNICTPANSAPPQKMRGSVKRAAKSPQAKPRTPAESAPPQISHEPPQILRDPHAESAPVTVLEPTANQKQKKTSSSSRARERAARIPDDFKVTPEMAEWARAKVPRVIAASRGKDETDQFVDHWLQSSLPTAWKNDWTAAWRTWMRRAEKDLAQNGTPGRPQQRNGAIPKTTTNDRVQNAIEAGKRLQVMLDGAK